MEVGKDGGGGLRIGPWLPDPVEAARSGGPATRVSEPVTRDIDADPVGRQAPPPVGADDAGDPPEPRRHTTATARRRWLVVALVVTALGAAVAVPLLRSSSPPRPGSPAMPATSGPAGVAAEDPSIDAGADPSPAPATPPPSSAPPRAAPSKAARVPAPRPAPVTYEAEAAGNYLDGTAQVADYPGASGGRIVRNIGNWRGVRKVGSLRFAGVTAPATGTYVLTFFSVHLDGEPTRTAVITVSGSPSVTVSVSGSATCCAATRLRITLQRGANTITFTNPTGHAPSIDKIVISAA